jgi:hypothetical protein
MGGVIVENTPTPIPCKIAPLTVEVSRKMFGENISKGYIFRSTVQYETGQKFDIEGDIYSITHMTEGRRKTLYALEST